MNTSENIDVLSDVLLDDERIVSPDEREFLADLLRHSENNTHPSNFTVTQAIAKIAGEIVVQRAGSLMAENILRKLTEPALPRYGQYRREALQSTENSRPGTCMPPKPPGPTPPNPGPGPGGYHAIPQNRISSLPPKPPGLPHQIQAPDLACIRRLAPREF